VLLDAETRTIATSGSEAGTLALDFERVPFELGGTIATVHIRYSKEEGPGGPAIPPRRVPN